MEKLKIIGVDSEDYPGGRIDSFRIRLPNDSPHHSHIIPLFIDLGFPKEAVNEKLDVIYFEIEYIFIYGNPKIKAYLTADEGELTIRFDTRFSKEEINRIIEKYLEFSNK